MISLEGFRGDNDQNHDHEDDDYNRDDDDDDSEDDKEDGKKWVGPKVSSNRYLLLMISLGGFVQVTHWQDERNSLSPLITKNLNFWLFPKI